MVYRYGFELSVSLSTVPSYASSCDPHTPLPKTSSLHVPETFLRFTSDSSSSSLSLPLFQRSHASCPTDDPLPNATACLRLVPYGFTYMWYCRTWISIQPYHACCRLPCGTNTEYLRMMTPFTVTEFSGFSFSENAVNVCISGRVPDHRSGVPLAWEA